MPTMHTWSANAERAAFRGITRACSAALDSVSLRREVVRRAAQLIPSEAYFFNVLDPDTGLVTHAMGEGAPKQLARRFFQVLYPAGEAERTIDLARTGRLVTTESHHEMARAFREAGFQRELRAAFALADQPWGLWCSLREHSSRPFGARELAFLRKVAPHIARGLRTAALCEIAESARMDEALTHAVAVPGVLVVDSSCRVMQRTGAATWHLDDLSDAGPCDTELPPPVLGVIARRRYAEQRDASWTGELRVRGRSGRWYSLQAALTEPDAMGRESCVVIITPVGRAEVAPLLAKLYGLSPREREVTAMVARGHSSKEIARRLQISPYTVQEHLDHAAEKVGVRGRRALLAKLFFDGYARKL